MDKKEEVIDIELTPYGKQLLSMGKMKPVYYAFFDDNIMYDAEYAGLTENQNIIQQRITELTPQIQTQYKFTSKGTEGTEVDFGNGEKVSTIAPLKKNALAYDLGSARLSGQDYPAIDIRMLSGFIKDVDLNYLTEFGNKRIPQINMEVTYTIEEGNVSISPSAVTVSPQDVTRIALDGSFLSITPEIILADIVERNTDFKIENFSIEAYEVGETLIPLTFAKKTQNKVVNNILLDEIPEEDQTPVSLSPDNVEYYFDIFVDSDIDREVINNAVSVLKSKGLYTDKEYVNEDNVLIREVIADIYGTNVTVTDIKDC